MVKCKGRLIRIFCILIAGFSLTSPSLLTWAAVGPGETQENNIVPGLEIPAHIADEIVEFSELADMIHYYNPSVQSMASSHQESITDYENALQEMRDEKELAGWDKERAEDSGDMEDYAYYAGQRQIYHSGIESYQKALDRLARPSSQASQKKVERQLTVASQSLMISYESLVQQEQIRQKLTDIYQKEYELEQLKHQTGMATGADLLRAERQVKASESTALELKAQKQQVYDSLCFLIKGASDGSLVIQPVPAPDIQRIEGMNLKEDTEKAIGNNYQLIEERTSLDSDSTASADRKRRAMEESEAKLSITMGQLYDTVLEKKAALTAATTGYTQAQAQKQADEIKYAGGMMSQEDYLKSELSFLQKQAEYDSSCLALEQAMDAYDWAVMGIVS